MNYKREGGKSGGSTKALLKVLSSVSKALMRPLNWFLNNLHMLSYINAVYNAPSTLIAEVSLKVEN